MIIIKRVVFLLFDNFCKIGDTVRYKLCLYTDLSDGLWPNFPVKACLTSHADRTVVFVRLQQSFGYVVANNSIFIFFLKMQKLSKNPFF